MLTGSAASYALGDANLDANPHTYQWTLAHDCNPRGLNLAALADGGGSCWTGWTGFLNRVSEVRVLPGYHFFQFRSIEFANQFP